MKMKDIFFDSEYAKSQQEELGLSDKNVEELHGNTGRIAKFLNKVGQVQDDITGKALAEAGISNDSSKNSGVSFEALSNGKRYLAGGYRVDEDKMRADISAAISKIDQKDEADIEAENDMEEEMDL